MTDVQFFYLFLTGSGEIAFGPYGCQMLKGYVEVNIWVRKQGAEVRGGFEVESAYFSNVYRGVSMVKPPSS